jgi:CHAT domain-containing protein
MQQVRAHYLSYFVDEEETYAVLVAKDGSLYSQVISLGKKTLREWSVGINPKYWGKFPFGPDGPRMPKDMPDRFAPLVKWLEPLVDAGLLHQGEHICYCPDEELHLVPLHYVTFRGQPLVCHFSLSRIHGAQALQILLQRAPATPSQFIALHVPTRQDLTDKGAENKLSNLRRAPNWLSEHLSGHVVQGENADWSKVKQLDWQDQIAHFAMHGTFPDADNANANRDPNPYSASGLVLAKHGQLPDLVQVFQSGKVDDALLSPQKVMGLDFCGSHISLMACVSGLARESISGDALGLEWAFLQAGATSLLSTHWNIPASASAEFSVRFYQKWLVNKLSRAASWRETILELMDVQWGSQNPPPYYWAGFSLSGDWR